MVQLRSFGYMQRLAPIDEIHPHFQRLLTASVGSGVTRCDVQQLGGQRQSFTHGYISAGELVNGLTRLWVLGADQSFGDVV